MPQIPTTQDVVLTKILERIRSQVTYVVDGQNVAFNETTMFLAWSADQAAESQPSHNYVWGCVVPLQGTPGDAEFIGAGKNFLNEYTGCTVMFFTTRRADQGGHAKYVMTDTAGLLAMKRKILKALTEFIPVDGSGNLLLTNPMQPISCDPPRRPDGSQIADLAVTFTTDFEWDLS